MPKLSRAAFVNAFLCPGVGHFMAGWRVTGAFMACAAVGSLGAPILAFIVGVATREACWEGMGICTKQMLGHAWSMTWPLLLAGIPTFVVVYAVGVLHGNRLTVPEKPAS